MHILGWIIWAATVAALLWWLSRGWSPEPPHAEKFAKAALKLFFWFVAVAFIIGWWGSLAAPGMVTTSVYVGGGGTLLLMVLGFVVGLKEDEDKRRDQRLKGFPTVPRLVPPWASAVMVGVAGFFVMVIGLYTVVLMRGMQAALQAQSDAFSGAPPFSEQSQDTLVRDAGDVITVAGIAWLIVTFLAWAIQRYRRWRAETEYDQLCRGIEVRVSVSAGE